MKASRKFAFRRQLKDSNLSIMIRTASANRPDLIFHQSVTVVPSLKGPDVIAQHLPWVEIALFGKGITSSGGEHEVMTVFAHLNDLHTISTLLNDLRFTTDHAGYMSGLSLDNPFRETHPTKCRLAFVDTSVAVGLPQFKVNLATVLRGGRAETEQVIMSLTTLLDFRDAVDTALTILQTNSGR